MPMTPGLGLNLRQPADEADELSGEDVIVEIVESNDNTKLDEQGNILEIEHPDGSITISLDGKPIESKAKEKDEDNWFRNLVDDIAESKLGSVAEDLLRGIRDDLESRILVSGYNCFYSWCHCQRILRPR
jgi:hypothetical protein